MTQASGVVTANWTLPVDPIYLAGGIEWYTDPTTDPTYGYFVGSDGVGGGVGFQIFDPPGRDTSWSSDAFPPFPPGTYYFHVSAYDSTKCITFLEPDCLGDEFTTPPVRLDVPGDVTPPPPPPPPVRPPPPPPPPPPADKVTSLSALKCAATQKAGILVVQASMPENGTITVGGTLNVPNAAKVFKLKAVSVSAPAGKIVKVTVKLPSKVLKAVKKAIRKHKKVKANLTITARDVAGNTKLEKRSVKLRS